MARPTFRCRAYFGHKCLKSRSGTFLILFQDSPENLGKMVNARFSKRKNRETRLNKFMTTYILFEFTFETVCLLSNGQGQSFIGVFRSANCCLKMWSIVVVLVRLHGTFLCRKCVRPTISEYCWSGHTRLSLTLICRPPRYRPSTTLISIHEIQATPISKQ